MIAPTQLRNDRLQRDAVRASLQQLSDNISGVSKSALSLRERGADHPGQIDFAIWLGGLGQLRHP